MSATAFAQPRLPLGLLTFPVFTEDSVPVFNQDPAWVRFNERRHARLLAERDALHASEAPLLADLAAIGLAFGSIWNLVHARRRYPEAIPVLVRHLDANYPPYIQEGIARALAAPEARGRAGAALLRALRAAPVGDAAFIELRIALAHALVVVASPADRSGLGQLIANPAQAILHPILERALRAAQSRRRGLYRLAA